MLAVTKVFVNADAFFGPETKTAVGAEDVGHVDDATSDDHSSEANESGDGWNTRYVG